MPKWVYSAAFQRATMAAAAAVQVWSFTLHPVGSLWQLVPLACLVFLGWAQWRIERSRRAMRQAFAWLDSEGARPQGVVVHHANGTTTPVELAYGWRDEEGVHVWVGDTTFGPGDTVEVEVLPPRSAVNLPMRPPWDAHG